MRNYIITFAEQIKKTNFAKYSVRAKKEDKKTRRRDYSLLRPAFQWDKSKASCFLNLTKQIIN